MNYSTILKLLSVLLGVLALAFSACAAVSVYFSSDPAEPEALQSWICIIALAVTIAFSLYLPSRNAPGRLFKKEAMFVVGFGWIFGSVLGALPYVMILNCSFADAFFESASGISTTGASVFGDTSVIPRSLMFWRMLSHWIGGLGVVVFFVVILSFLGASARVLYSNEASNAGGGMDTERIRTGAFKMFFLYLAMSAACVFSFKLCGMSWFDGVCHMFSTVATGGFTVYSDGFAHYKNSSMEWVAIIFMTLGGTSFAVLLALFSGKFKTVLKNTELWVYLGIIVCSSIVVAFSVFYHDAVSTENFASAIRESTFQCVSILTTTGFYSYDYQEWLPLTHVIFFSFCIIGGCAGSTAGGMKVWRIAVAFKICKRNVETSIRPRLVRNIFMNGKTVSDETAFSVLSFFMLYFLVIIIGIIVVSLIERQVSFAGCLTAVVACIGNIGPGLNEVGPTQNYAFFSDITKGILAFLMIMGRLELYAVLALFLPSLWQKFK